MGWLEYLLLFLCVWWCCEATVECKAVIQAIQPISSPHTSCASHARYAWRHPPAHPPACCLLPTPRHHTPNTTPDSSSPPCRQPRPLSDSSGLGARRPAASEGHPPTQRCNDATHALPHTRHLNKNPGLKHPVGAASTTTTADCIPQPPRPRQCTCVAPATPASIITAPTCYHHRNPRPPALLQPRARGPRPRACCAA